jgi:predicted RecB family nuclease
MFITADLLLNYQRCSRRAFLDRYGDAEQKDPPNDYLLKLIQDSAENRRQVLSTQEHRQPTYKSGDWSKGAEETLKLMRAGVERIYQPVLLAEEGEVTLVANPDLLVKRPGRSIFGDWIYVPTEIKLSKRPKQEYQIIVAYFVKVLAAVQGAWVEEAWLILKERGAFAVDLWEVIPRMDTILTSCIEAVTGDEEPEVFISRSRCSLCHWFSHCYTIAKSDNHLSLLPGVTQSRYLQLQALNITTLEALAETPPAQLEPLPGFGSETARKIVSAIDVAECGVVG